jgi:hypothetical protein
MMSKRRALIPSAILAIVGFGSLALWVVSLSADKANGAENAAETVLRRVNIGDYEALYESLFPRQRRQIDREVFVRCYREKTEGFVIKKIDAIRSREQPPEPVVGSVELWKSTLVTLEMEINGRPARDSMHVYLIDGQWHWTLVEDEFERYADGECLDD